MKQRTQPLSLKRNFFWAFLGNAVYAGSQWGMLVLLVKLGSPEVVGQFAYGLALTAPVFMLLNLQLREIQATDAANQYSFSDYLGLRLLTTILALSIIGAFALVGSHNPYTLIVILMVGLAKGVESVSDIVFGLMQKNERLDRIAISLFTKGVLSLVSLGVVFYVTRDLIISLAGLALVWVLVLVCYDLRVAIKTNTRRLRPRFKVSNLWSLVGLSFPLGLVVMLISLNVNLPRYFIEFHLGIEDLGFFAAVAYLMVVGRTIIAALGQSAIPRLARYHLLGKRGQFLSLVKKLLAVGLLVGIGGVVIAVLVGSELLSLIYRPEYAHYNDVFIWLMVAAGLSYIAAFFGNAMVSARVIKVQMPLLFVVTVSLALACYWLIPNLGLIGAAISVVIGLSVHVVGAAGVFIQIVRRLPPNLKREGSV